MSINFAAADADARIEPSSARNIPAEYFRPSSRPPLFFRSGSPMPTLVRSAAAPFSRADLPRADLSLPLIAGYEPVRLLAAGRWFELYLCRVAAQPTHASPDYVVKRIRPNHADGNLPRALLQREAQVAASVSQANLVSLLDAGLHEPCPFIVLPYLPGKTLEQIRQTPGQTAVPQALWYIRQVAAALAALHTAGWLHSDVKPQNMIISEQGHATLIDLGLARQLDSAECAADRWLAGDADYLAPEAFQPQRQLTAAADIYSLGLVLLRLLQGAKSKPEPIDPRRTFSDLRSQRPDVSRDVAHLLAKMLAQEPLRRPTASELVETLSRLEIESLMQW
jgi:serine/threonine protein kinase